MSPKRFDTESLTLADKTCVCIGTEKRTVLFSLPYSQAVIFIIIIIFISFMQGICTYSPATNYVPREYSVAANLLFLFMVQTSPAPVLNLLHFYISTFGSMCAVPNMAVVCSSLTSWIPGTLLRYFLNDFEVVPVASIITGITFVINNNNNNNNNNNTDYSGREV
jgi:hypothetical protein